MVTTDEKRSVGSTPPPSITSSPFLVFPHGRKYRSQTFFNLSDNTYHPKSIPEMRNRQCFASTPDGWLLMLHLEKMSSSCYLFNPISLTKIDLPSVPMNFTYNFGAITCSPTHDPNNCVVVFISQFPPSCVFCHPIPSTASSKWIQQDIEPQAAKHKIIVRTSDVVSCQGKVYLIGYYGIAVVDFSDCISTTTTHYVSAAHAHAHAPAPAANITIHPLRPEFSIPNVGPYTSTLVESCGDIFLVEMIYLGIHKKVRTMDVFKLDLSSMVWVKVQSLYDRIFLLGINSVSISAIQLGLRGRGDYIYFYETEDTSLYRFDMGDGIITVTRPCPNVVRQWNTPYWLVPTTFCNRSEPQPYLAGILLVNQQGINVKETKQEEVNDQTTWKDLNEILNDQTTWKDLNEILELVMSHLFLDDCTRFRLTCKTWLSIAPSLRLTPLPVQSHSRFQQHPWLISLPKNDKILCKFHHPVYNDSYLMDAPEFSGAYIHHSKYGWLLMSKLDQDASYLFFLNPFTRQTIKLPELPESYCRTLWGATFSAPPTSSDYIVFGLRESRQEGILVYRCGEDSWKAHSLESYFIASSCNPVFYDGFFYCLGHDGKLGVFNANKELEDENEEEELEGENAEEEDPNEDLVDESKWKVVPNLIGPNMSIHRSYIAECDGEIISVFIGRLGNPICVYKLNRSSKMKMKWVKIESLGDKVLFLSHTTSILMPAKLKGIKDMIYLPMFHEKQSVFYSLQTGRYHCFGTKHLGEDWMNTSEEWHCTWIESPADGIFV